MVSARRSPRAAFKPRRYDSSRARSAEAQPEVVTHLFVLDRQLDGQPLSSRFGAARNGNVVDMRQGVERQWCSG
jgi:hypothetical protein